MQQLRKRPSFQKKPFQESQNTPSSLSQFFSPYSRREMGNCSSPIPFFPAFITSFPCFYNTLGSIWRSPGPTFPSFPEHRKLGILPLSIQIPQCPRRDISPPFPVTKNLGNDQGETPPCCSCASLPWKILLFPSPPPF